MKKFRITINGQSYEVEVEEISQPTPAASAPAVEKQTVHTPSGQSQVFASVPAAAPAAANDGKTIKAPMPGKIIAVKVKAGDKVRAGEVVAVLEAMKMENEILASADGIIREVRVQDGANVNPGDPIVILS